MSRHQVESVVDFPGLDVQQGNVRRSAPGLTTDGGPPHDSDMENRIVERVAKLEGAVKVAGGALGLLLAAVLALISISAAFIIFNIEDAKEQIQAAEQRTNARMSSIESKVDALPGQLTDIANALSNAMAAGRSTASPMVRPTPDDSAQ